MGAAAGAIAPVAALAGTGLQAFGSYEKGAGQQAADSAQAAEFKVKAGIC